MKEIEQYVEEITKDLPDAEKEELREEMVGHLHEHVKELLIEGYREEEAVCLAIDSFGDGGKLNQEFKRSFFPTYKLVRFAWAVMWTVVGICSISYVAMEYYHPEFDNGLNLFNSWTLLFYVASLAGAGELMHDALQGDIKRKWKWVLNPWLFLMVPPLIISGVQLSMLFIQPEQYQDGRWLDLFGFAQAALMYVTARQLFTHLFLNGNIAKRNVVK
ncbi:hypothetical protein H0266_14435 [Halobacillus locisalis]|uniref:Uncharacterized protein n=1 Tax=Halobacillus locisalis TaxID=220753 RepID=A0A838CVZ5_9BACI|nr:permease prefix domain 1-containing protein [Halobacillus locisalis]MBA2176091.1 hypothetical protein [Halobacillus locisalis]